MEIGDFLKDLSERLTDILPPTLKTLKSDCEKNMHSVLVGAFSKLDLVTREEFDTQAKVLTRSRQKIATLEAKIQMLEQQIQDLPHAK